MLLLVMLLMVFKGLLSDYCTIAACMCAEARWHWNRQGPGQSMSKVETSLDVGEVEKKWSKDPEVSEN